MRPLVVAVLVAVAALALVAVSVLMQPSSTGAGWDDDSDTGHSRLTNALAATAQVHVIESGIGVLPRDAGSGDVLFLFPTHRPTTGTEQSRVEDFVAAGGRLVLVADGNHGAPVAARFGIGFKGFPAVLPPERSVPCIDVDAEVDGLATPICLPSPSALSTVTGDGIEAFRPHQEVFLDIDGSGGLNVGDQGPDRFPMVARFTHGNGDVILVTDADLWRNGVVAEHSQNLDFATAAAAGRTIYLDASAAPSHFGEAWMQSMQRVISAPGPFGALALAGFLVALVVSVAALPIATPWKPHKEAGGIDSDLEDKVQHLLAVMAKGEQGGHPPET